MASLRTTVRLAAVAAFAVGHAAAELIPMTFCATFNTASMQANSSIYQSDGLCRDFCSASKNAFAIVKDSNCWCSDYTPANSIQVDTNKCNTPCPGFPSDTCGGAGVWGYIKLSAQPLGVKGGDNASPTSPPPTEIPPTTAAVPTTLVPTPTPDPPKTSSTRSSTTKPTAPNTNPPPSNTATTPVVVVSTVTANGGTSQVTITLPASNNSNNAASNSEMSTAGEGLTTGAAVGIAVGVLGIVAIIAGVCVFFWLRRRKQTQQEAAVERSNSGRGSSAGMMGTPRTEMASIWDSEQLSTGRRNSRLMPHDPRMDPFAGNIYAQANKSRESINTLQDNHDYSRKVLRTTNPDPDQD
ncbi:cell wall integrity and stress response component [Microdochium nivale]|nr:cell wall integrity and stress response component [Microdochium nivale]